MSSNANSEENLQRSGINNYSSQQTLNNNEIEHQISYFTSSNNINLKDSTNSDSKSKIFQLRVSLKQKEDQVYSLKNINSNLKAELKAQKELEEQTKGELIQHKLRRKD